MNDSVIAIIDGFPSSHWRICLSERPNIPVPARQVQTDEVLGRLGSFYTKFGYNDMTIDLDFNYLEDVTDFKAFKDQFPYIRSWLEHGEKLSFSDSPNEYFLMQTVKFGNDVVNDMVEFGEFTVTVTLAPFARVVENAPVPLVPNSITLDKTHQITMFNASVEPSLPHIVLTATGNFQMMVTNGVEHVRRGIALNISLAISKNRLHIDCEKKIIYFEDEIGNKDIVTEYDVRLGYPILGTGANTFLFRTQYVTDTPPVISNVQVYRNMLR